jgi:pyruvate/2-oxoglutarate dehydrogenase complex dihydrolipoamide dehydrogenase (E3) component
VTLLEKAKHTGGMVLTAAATMPYRAEFAGSVTWLRDECQRLGVKILTGVEGTVDTIRALVPDVVIVATGATPGLPAVPGAEQSHVVTVPQAIHDGVTGDHIVIVDCGEADWKSLTTAECLASRGHRVTVVSPTPAGVEIDIFSKPTLLRRLAAAKVNILEYRSLVSIGARDVTLMHGWSKATEVLDSVDAVVASWYGIANDSLRAPLEELGIEVHLVGDSLAPRRAIDAIWDGFRIGREL